MGLYRAIGERLKHQFVGNEAWIICSREELFENIGLKPSFRIPLINGSLDCEFRKYQIFDGKMQDFREKGGIVKTDEERKRMAEKRRFKADRDFKKRFDDPDSRDDEDEDDIIPGYMRRLHREFERNHSARSRREGDEAGDRHERRERRHTPAERRPSGSRRDNGHKGSGKGRDRRGN